MKRTRVVSSLVATVAVSACAPLEPVEQVADVDDGDEVCRMEAAIGTHVKEVTCKPTDDSRAASDDYDDRAINGIFGDITVDRVSDRTPPEGKCGVPQD